MSAEGPAGKMGARAFAAGLGLLATCAAYLLVTAGKLPLLVYLPLEGRWTFHPSPAALGMDWYFRAGVSLLAGALGGVGGGALSHRAGERGGRLALGLALSALLWAVLFTAFFVAAGRLAAPDG